MEPSKSISTIIAKLKIAYPYYFKELSNEEFIGLISMYQEELGNYNDLTLTTAIKTIIRNNKFMPTLKEIIDECERCRTYNGNSILEKMRNDGYFSRGIKKLSSQQEIRNYEKALHWFENGVVPLWLLNDMKKYGYQDNVRLLFTKNNNYLEMKG